jgi:Flp pilus assembly protein TadG
MQQRTQEDGQSLIETAMMVPLLLLLVCGAVDYGYFMIAAANLTSAARVAAQYSVQGTASPAQAALPNAFPSSDPKSVSALALADLSGLLNGSTTTTVYVCSQQIGTTGDLTQCQPSGGYTPDADPEAPTFFLNRVDVVYTVTPPVPMGFFSFQLLPSMKFHRQVSMRAMN